MSLLPPAQNLDVIEASTRQASADVLRGTGVEWEFVVRGGDPAHELEAEDRSTAPLRLARTSAASWPAPRAICRSSLAIERLLGDD
jgi:hypothetical protein